MRPKGWYSRGYLPHYDGGEILQFVTLHLADALPQSLLRRWRIELEQARDEERKLELQRRIERHLDMGAGECLLGVPEVAAAVQEAIIFRHGKQYKLICWCLMPNHIHFMFRPKAGFSLSDIMHGLKSYTAHEANKIVGRRGKFWQEDYFDRFIRDHDHFMKTRDYIELNPVKAGLCSSKYDWPYGSAYQRRADERSALESVIN
ncbi:MAG: transposase [Pyrinomonadaceae bacterium]